MGALSAAVASLAGTSVVTIGVASTVMAAGSDISAVIPTDIPTTILTIRIILSIRTADDMPPESSLPELSHYIRHLAEFVHGD